MGLGIGAGQEKESAAGEGRGRVFLGLKSPPSHSPILPMIKDYRWPDTRAASASPPAPKSPVQSTCAQLFRASSGVGAWLYVAQEGSERSFLPAGT